MSNMEHKTTLSGDTSTSIEDYLEAILVLGRRTGASVRVTDVSAYLGVSKPSVSAAAKKLATAGLVEHERYGAIRLTKEGRQGALRVAARHELLLRFLVEVLGVEQATAEEDACRLEHFLSEETVDRLHQFVGFLTDGADPEDKGPMGFEAFMAAGKTHADLLERWRCEALLEEGGESSQ